MLHDILSPIVGENRSKDGSADNTAPNNSKGVVPTIPISAPIG